MIDSFNRKIDYVRISLTDLCNFRCFYCMPEEGVSKRCHKEMLSYEEFMIIIKALAELGIKKIRFTGGEPLVKKGATEFIARVAKSNLVDSVNITTNGSLLKDSVKTLSDSGVKSINISIDSLDSAIYKMVTRGGNLNDVLEGIQECVSHGVQVKLNCVLLKGINDDKVFELASFANKRGATIRFIELMPFSYSTEMFDEYFIKSSDVLAKYPELKIVDEPLESGNNCQYYTFPTGEKVGFISPLSNIFCQYCNRIRVTADGKLILCLHSTIEYDLKPYLDDFEGLKSYIIECVNKKPKQHMLADKHLQSRKMNAIGG